MKHHYCPLPTLGTLMLQEKNAQIDTINKQITAPITEIKFEKNVTSADDFIQFIAKKKVIQFEEAKSILNDFCKDISSINHLTEKSINHTGYFFVDKDGVLGFHQNDIGTEFMPSIEAYRVTHPNQSHTILVGDQERKAIFQKTDFEKTGKIAKKLWWISAVIIFLIALGICIFSLQNGYNGDFWRNKTTIKPAKEVKTYRVIQ